MMLEKYQEWSKVLIEPSTSSLARIYALESRLHEEENSRAKDLQWMRENFTQLVISLEA
jgi:hypothetical protein